MRLIHTSDWHLGRSFHQVGLLDAQADYLDHLVEVVRTEHVDAVLVSGDVYDRAMPPPDAVRLLSESLARLVDAGAQVVLTSGNHDSSIRLGFASALLERAGLHIRAGVDGVGDPVLINDCAVYPIPYLDPASTTVAERLGVTTRSHAAVLDAAMERVRADASGRGPDTVVMAHCFAAGGVPADSERDITIGGVSAVPLSCFDGIGYTALGHLHGAQRLSDSVRYSGSPVAMSFSEAGHTKASTLVTVAGGRVTAEQIAAPVRRPLAVLRGRIDDLLTDVAHAEAERCFVQITLTDAQRPLAAMDRLRTRFPHTLSLQFEPEGGERVVGRYTDRVRCRPSIEVARDFVTDVRGGTEPSHAEHDLLRSALEHGRRGSGTAAEEGDAGAGAAA